MAGHLSVQKCQIPVRPKGGGQCVSHRQNNVIFACLDCKILICATCSIGPHKPHDLVEISSLTMQNKNLLQDFVDENEANRLPQLQKDILAAKQSRTPNSSKFKGLAKKIKHQVEKCKEEMETVAAELLSLCDEAESDNDGLIQQYITKLEERYDTLTEKTKECKKALQTNDNIEMYDVLAEVNKLETMSPCKPSLKSAQFYPGKDITGNLKRAIGRLDISIDQANISSGSGQAGGSSHSSYSSKSGQTWGRGQAGQSGQGKSQAGGSDQASGNEDNKDTSGTQVGSRQSIMSKTDFRLYDDPREVSKFFFDYAITCICPTPDGKWAWISYQYSNPAIAVELMDNKGHIICKLQHRKTITDISVSPTTGTLWFCCDSDKTINELPLSAESAITRFRVVEKPETLCVSKEGYVIVGTASRQNNLMIYSVSGTILRTAAVSKYGVTEPLNIVECPITGNIAITRGKQTGRNSTQFHIIVYDKFLKLKSIYKGEGRQSVKPFEPSSIAYDRKGNILFVNYPDCTIELINGNGQYITCLHTADEQGQIGVQMMDNVVWAEMQKDGGRDVQLLKFYEL